jgi:hypothetical protein
MDSVGLCHGASGNAYLFLQLYAVTTQAEWMVYAKDFAGFVAANAVTVAPEADRPLSLYEGAAGALAFLSDFCFLKDNATRSSPVSTFCTLPGFC